MDQIVVGGVWFGRSVLGIVVRPYETYRRIIDRGSVWELGFIGIALAVYFSVASVVRIDAFRPLLLTAHFMKLATGVGMTCLGMSFVLWRLARFFGGKGRYRVFLVGWGYTLIPTLVWFLVTSILFIVFPPPRSASSLGVLFSLLYLVFSAMVFFWKVTLGYLAIRFGMRLDFVQILKVALISIPIIGAYSIATYKLGIFRIPFL